ncbi:MAG: DNA repair protein RecN [Spirochaetaceae bacterium]|jgi:DNA repair protein RecN (Recombination protein N)|nr:DNA repair protein RecN [Spirochaetaceae bacterium]
MLLELSVRNYALIDSLSVSFESGLNIITGETGAGKSIIVGAISFLLGAKADADVIRGGCDEASVSARLSVNGANAELAAWLAGREIELEDGELLVRRLIKQNGRNSIFIQNAPVTRGDLAECMSMIFDIHGQHAHESLLRPTSHRKYLDHFAGLEAEALEFNEGFRELSAKRKLLENSAVSAKEREARKELLSYAIDEIETAALKSGESRELEAESSKLASFEKLAGCIENACEAFCDSEDAALPLVRRAHNAVESAAALDSGISALDGRLSDLYYEAEDIAQELKSYRESLRFDPQRLEYVEERLARISKLKKKYGAGKAAENGFAAGFKNTAFQEAEQQAAVLPEDAILAYKAAAEAELEGLSNTEESKEMLHNEISALEKTIYEQARALSIKRSKAGAELSARITTILRHLGMPAAAFSVSLEQKAGRQAASEGENGGGAAFVIGPYGADDVEFLFTANKGESVRELARIASGGELSRVMLAIKTALTASGGLSDEGGASGAATGGEGELPFTGGRDGMAADGGEDAETLIFDEIDTGIGGEVAGAVGAYLAKIGRIKQIFCVTHLAVIAARAHNHLKVEKHQQNDRTITHIRTLKGGERRQEIARMLSGNASEAALVHAEELLRKHGEQPWQK